MEKKSAFDQFIQYKALSLKFDDSATFLDMILESDEGKKLPLRNVCAKLHESLIERLDNTINNLGVSKRQFIEYAIIEALDRADEIIGDVMDEGGEK